MTTAVLCISRQMTAPTLLADLQAAGIRVSATQADVTKLVREIAVHAPDVLVCDQPLPTSSWFQALQRLQESVPCPVLVFTNDMDAGHIRQSAEAGIHVYVVNGYSVQRLRALVLLAQARFVQARQQRRALDEATTRLEERKAVDRAKGILMRDQQLSDDDAFRVLRSGAMRSNQRLGQLSQQIIQSAHFADALNRSGQLRMLSQRLLKLHWLARAGVQAEQHAALLRESMQRVDDNVEHLRQHLSAPSFGDLLAPVALTWQRLKAELAHDDPGDIDALAETLLQDAERLTASLETSGHTPPLQLLNLAGRQRMLSQRYARFALQALAGAPASAPAAPADAGAVMLATQQEFESALTYLNNLPLRSADIQDTLRDAGIAWLKLVAAARTLARADSNQRAQPLEELAAESEALLQLFEQLATQYAHSLEMLLG